MEIHRYHGELAGDIYGFGSGIVGHLVDDVNGASGLPRSDHLTVEGWSEQISGGVRTVFFTVSSPSKPLLALLAREVEAWQRKHRAPLGSRS